MNKYAVSLLALLFLIGCDDLSSGKTQSSSGVTQATARVATGIDGLTVEQRNIRDRLAMDNKVGSIKHLYVISAYTGQVIIYSTVKGKVTSSGKRLAPTTVAAFGGQNTQSEGVLVNIGGHQYQTNEVLQDDGSFGSSVEYLYWWDTKGIYHQHYVAGGQIVHISDQPIAVKSIIINMELTDEK